MLRTYRGDSVSAQPRILVQSPQTHVCRHVSQLHRDSLQFPQRDGRILQQDVALTLFQPQLGLSGRADADVATATVMRGSTRSGRGLRCLSI